MRRQICWLVGCIVTAIISGCAGSDSEIEAADKPTYVQPIPKDSGATSASVTDALVNVLAYHWKSHTVLDEVAVVLEDSGGNRSSDKGFTSRILPVGAYQVSVSPPAGSGSRETAVDLKDALATLKLAIGIESINGTDAAGKTIEVSAYQRAAADFNSDGKVDLKDALEILKYSIGVPVNSSARWQYFHDTEGISRGLPPQTELTKNKRSIVVNGLNTIGVAAVLVGDVDGSWRPNEDKARVAPSYFTALVDTLQAADKNASLARWGIVDQSTETIATIISRSYKDGIETVTYSDGSQTQIAAIAAERIFSINGIFEKLVYYFSDRDTKTYTLSGNVAGLATGEQVTLLNNASDGTTVSANGNFSFSSPIAFNGSYSITVSTQPTGKICTISNGSSSAIYTNVTNIEVTCLKTANDYFLKSTSFLKATYPSLLLRQINTASIDINGDGKLDMVIHFMGGMPSTYSGNDPTPNAIRIYIQQQNGQLLDQTSDYLVGTDSLVGGSRKIKAMDINGDGKLDLLFAINHEDGRNLEGLNANAQLASLVSVGNKYKVVYFGRQNFYHSVGAAVDSGGRVFALGEGFYGDGSDTFSTTAYYIDSSGSTRASNNALPKISSLSFEFFNPNGYNLPGKYIIQGGFGYLSNNGAIEGYQISSGVWTALKPLQPSPSVGNISLIDSGGKPAGSDVIYLSDDSYVVNAAYTESCKARINPTGEIVTIFLFAGRKIENYKNGQSTARVDQLTDHFKLRAFTVFNGDVVEVPLNISGEVTGPGSSGFFDCLDANGDGYDDIVVYSRSNKFMSIVYLNDKNGGFKYIGQDYWADFMPDLGNYPSAASVAADFNGDGIGDILVVLGDTVGPNNSVSSLFLKSSRKIN